MPDKIPAKDVEIYRIQFLGINEITPKQLRERIIQGISLVTGDFRQAEISTRWHEVLSDSSLKQNADPVFTVIRLRVHCSSGTYMRSLAHQIGTDIGSGACALSIKRTHIYLK